MSTASIIASQFFTLWLLLLSIVFFLVVLRIIMLRIHSNFLNMGILPLAQCATTLRAYDCFKAKWQQQEEKKEPHNGATRRSCTTF